MQQYFAIKQQFPDSLLFFQVGDFYELFFDDAKFAAAFLAIALTKRGKHKDLDIPLCGVPIHALDHYLRKLIKGGFKVALCDQLTKPTPGTIVERGVTNVFTPGTLTDSLMLDEKSASYLLAFYPTQESFGLVFSELLTAQLFATTLPADNKRLIEAELSRFFPDEIVLPLGNLGNAHATYFKQLGYCTSFTDAGMQGQDSPIGQPIAQAWLEGQFSNAVYKKIEHSAALSGSMEIFYRYLQKNNAQALQQFKSIQFYQADDYLLLDKATQKNLEIVENNHDGSRKNTLFTVLDKAKTAMGSRTIKKWLLRPLVQEDAIMQRQKTVTEIYKKIDVMQQLEEQLHQIADLERIIGRIALRRAQINDYKALQQSLSLMPTIKDILGKLESQLINSMQERIIDFAPLVKLLEHSINQDPSISYLIKRGFDHELDHLRDLAENGQRAIAQLEQQEITRTGINSLKIRFTDISGYYIEITNANLSQVPSDYKHQQTLVNRQRFTTPELTQLERDLQRAQHEITNVESAVFERIKREVEILLTPLRHTAQALAYLDGLLSFARVAYDNNYCIPTFNHDQNISINHGRHPVIETTSKQAFVANDTTLTDAQSLLIITGPNMGGKSTYLRQVALISLMAQCGSLVPAEQAELSILDRIFTRIGSGDNLAEGKSTFLVEMEETATICTQATKKSLVILDEVGRGTSTFDGIALAQAIIEHIHEIIKARCLFATHYHELTKLAEQHAGIKNYHLQCHKQGSTLHFLHKIAPGVATGSFGLDVARLAEIPTSIIKRAHDILRTLENQSPGTTPITPAILDNNFALHSTPKHHEEIITKLQNIHLDHISPKQAFDHLWQLVEEAKQKDIL